MIWILCILVVAIAARRLGVGPALIAALVCPPAAGAAAYALDSRAFDSLAPQIASLVLYVATCAVVIGMRRTLDRDRRRGDDASRLNREARVEAIRQISSGLAHELRNPLGVVRNAAYLLRRRISKLDVQTDLLDMIDGEVRSADAMLSGLTEAVRSPDPECSWVDLPVLARGAFDRVAARCPVQGDVQFAPELSSAWCDPRQFQQVFDALVQNAGEAMRGNGRVAIVGRRSGECDIIEISDSGPGIPPDLLEEVFEPLVTTKRGRSGLGLSRCRQIVTRHGGRIEALPRAGGGTTIRVTLPVKAPAGVGAGSTPAAPSREADRPAEKLAL